MIPVNGLALLLFLAVLFAIPAAASMLPLATKKKKTAWLLWTGTTCLGLFLFWPSYFQPGFNGKSLWVRNPASIEALGIFSLYLGGSFVTFWFWLYRRTNALTTISTQYRWLVFVAAYAPIVLTVFIFIAGRMWR